jgi:negative regulator of sigma E activity
VTPSRTVIVGSALPLLILVGLVGIPAARLTLNPQPSLVRTATASGLGAGSQTPAQASSEAQALSWLRRSISSGRELGFSGTEVVTAWHRGGASTRVLAIAQRPGGPRIATERGTSDRSAVPIGPAGMSPDALAGLSERALDALADGYQLRVAGRDQVAGRTATVIVVARSGRELARIWLDVRTGLLLRQDVLDQAGNLYRMAAFLDLRPVDGSLTPAGRTTNSQPVKPAQRLKNSEPVNNPEPLNTSEPVNNGTASAAVAWTEIPLAGLARWRAEGWPCPERLPEGFVLLDARRETDSSGSSVLHLTYGDGLSAISVFLQRGRLDDDRLTGLSSQTWGDAVLHVREGWPEVMVWQGGPTVITAVGEAEPARLRAVLSTLPRQAKRGTLDSLQHGMGSALAWFKG